MTVGELIRTAAAELAAAKVDNATGEAEILVGFVLSRDRGWLYSHTDQPVSAGDQAKLRRLLNKRIIDRQPVAYIIGSQPFAGVTLRVTPDVLIPRPETEQLVELAASKIRANHLERGRILDVGTGSGAIAISLKKLFPKVTVVASDNSLAALKLARQNAVANQTDIKFIRSDLLASVPKEPYDVIIANLPYVPDLRWSALRPEVRDWEPKLAIVGGKDGLGLVRKLIEQVEPYLKPTSLLMLELTEDQPEIVKKLILSRWPSTAAKVVSDLAGKSRFVIVELAIGRPNLTSN